MNFTMNLSWKTKLMALAVGLMASLAVVYFSNHGAKATAARHPLAQRFPALEGQLSARAEFSPAQDRVGGREVAGFRAHAPGAANHGGMAAPAGLKPAEREAWLQMARRQGAAGSQELASFYPAR